MTLMAAATAAAPAGAAERVNAPPSFTALASPFSDRELNASFATATRGRQTLSGAAASGSASASGGFTLDTPAGALRASPPAATAAARPGDVTVRVRPNPLGFTTSVTFRDPLRTRQAGWSLALPHARGARRLGDGAVGFLSAARGAAGGVRDRRLPARTRLVAAASGPRAVDVAGRRVAAHLSRTGRRMTVSVARVRGPVTVDVAWAPTGATGTGWWSHGPAAPGDDPRWAVVNGSRTAHGCGYGERGELRAGVVERSQQAAASTKGCRALVQTTRTVSVGASGPAAGAARRVHRNRAYNKSIQEDPVQIDVNSVTDRVDWRHNGRCVRPLRRSDSTDAYGPTGWDLTKKDTKKYPRRCRETTISTYAKFEGGEFFPACTGFKVTTIYADNFMQGKPSGKGGYYVYHVTGGPPCHELLHWDSKRGNKRVY